MKNLIIVGAGGFGREVLFWALTAKERDREWKIHGLLDDNPDALQSFSYDLPILSGIKDCIPRSNDCFVIAVGNPKVKLEIATILKQKRACLENIVHSSAVISGTAKIGMGCIIGPFTMVSCNSSIEDCVILNAYSNVGHDVKVGEGSTLSGHVDLTGRVCLGKGVFIGSNATVLPGTKIENFATVGAGSVVVRNVREGTSVFGNPAKTIAG